MTERDIENSIRKPYQFEFYRHPKIQQSYDKWLSENKRVHNNKNDKSLAIKRNNFPYYLEVPYRHYVAWYNGKWEDHQFHLYKEMLQQKYKKAFIFINSQQIRSVKSLPHFHIISKKHIPCIVLNVKDKETFM